MKLNIDEILKSANEHYAYAKLGESAFFKAPELRPTIQSDQVKSILTALVEAINEVLPEAGYRFVVEPE